MATPAGLRIVRVLAVSICCVICALRPGRGGQRAGQKSRRPAERTSDAGVYRQERGSRMRTRLS